MKIRLAAIVCILTIFMLACANPKQLEYRDIDSIQLKELSLKPKIGMNILMYNPNSYGVTMKSANIGVYINEKHVGDAVLDGKVKVPGLDSFLVPVILNADLSGVFLNAYSLLANKELNIRLQGNVKAGKGVFVNIPINYKGKKKLNVLDFDK